MQILVADDDPVNRAIVTDVLTKAGYRIIEAADGVQAQAILQAANAPRLVILDWMMPGLDGPALCRSLRTHADESYVYVIMLTSKCGARDLEAALSSGADDYLTKPFDPRELRARVARAKKMLERLEELHATREDFRLQSMQDPLTCLLNRGEIFRSLERELAFARRQGGVVSALMIDIDHFKQINDTYGHLAGDTVLREVAHLLRGATRSYDMCGRYGGEEFLVVLPGCEVADAVEAATRYRTNIGMHPIALHNDTVSVTVSIGVASSDLSSSMRASELFKAADEALYQAKRNGRNRVEVSTSTLMTTTGSEGREL